MNVAESSVTRVARSALARTSWRILPLLVLAYVCALMDRVNIGFASLQMNVDLGVSATVYGLGGGLLKHRRKLRLARRLLPELRTQSELADVKNVLMVHAAVLVLAAGVLGGCKKTSNGDVEVQTPRVTSETDTVKVPTVETSKETVTAVTPKVEVKKETTSVTVPKVTVKQKP